MQKNPYERFRGQLILRDYLAADRTLLAAERTLLAYLRTALGIIGIGVAFIKFFEESSVIVPILGWSCLPLGALIGVFGSVRYSKVRKSMLRVMEDTAEGISPTNSPDGPV